MAAYILRRVVFAVFLVFAVSSASLVLTRLAPGDYAIDAFGAGAGADAIERLRVRHGLDRPLGDQYRQWLIQALRFDFGRSLAYDRPVVELVSDRAGNTALLAVSALLVATLVGLPLGVVTGTRRQGVLTTAVRGASLLLLSMPPLLTSLLLVFAAARTGWFPIGGMTTSAAGGGSAADIAYHMVVPVLALALPLGAMFERLQSEAMRGVVAQPFVLAARARGVPDARIVWRDALRPALRPIASIYGLMVGTLLGGSFVVEVVTAWPGLGRLMLDALRARDMYLVAGCAAAGSVFLAVGALLSDLALAAADPRTAE